MGGELIDGLQLAPDLGPRASGIGGLHRMATWPVGRRFSRGNRSIATPLPAIDRRLLDIPALFALGAIGSACFPLSTKWDRRMTEPANDVSALAAEDPGFWVKELAERRTRHRIGGGRFRERQDDRIPQMKLRRQARRSAT
jgi:hypothetical protein